MASHLLQAIGDELFPKNPDGKYKHIDVDHVETWQGMEDALAQGLTNSIGLSNFNRDQMQRVLDHCSVLPVVNQVYTFQSHYGVVKFFS